MILVEYLPSAWPIIMPNKLALLNLVQSKGPRKLPQQLSLLWRRTLMAATFGVFLQLYRINPPFFFFFSYFMRRSTSRVRSKHPLLVTSPSFGHSYHPVGLSWPSISAKLPRCPASDLGDSPLFTGDCSGYQDASMFHRLD